MPRLLHFSEMATEAHADSLQRAERASPFRLQVVACCFFLLCIVSVFSKIKAREDGHFVYPLDDPYIHLALSEQIGHGFYGINPGETSSPSSSILWPFLLAPSAGLSYGSYVPLVLNIVFGLAACCLLAHLVADWFPRDTQSGPGDWWMHLLTVVLLIFVGNLVGLTFVGMEHVLQVLLAIACAVGLCQAWEGRPIPWWCLLAAAIAPMVRYEDLSLTLAVSVGLVTMRQTKKAVILFVGSLVPLGLFAWFLHTLGLPPLPTSVLVKGSGDVHGSGALHKIYELLRDSYHGAMVDPARWVVLALGILLGCFLAREKDRVRRGVLIAGVLVALLQMTFGRFGWFNRYELYAVLFLTLLFVRAVTSRPPVTWSTLLFGLFCLAIPYLAGTTQIVERSDGIYRQQFQMHRFVADFYRHNVAINDLGLVSYRRPPGVYVLDVVGLASIEAARTPDKSGAWLKGIAERHGVGLAIVYPEFLQIPPSWTPVAKMCDTQIVVGPAERCVVFYGTSPESTAEVRRDALRFGPTLPKGVTLEMDPARSEGGIYIPPPH